MNVYKKYIKPVVEYPKPNFDGSIREDIENPAVWYPEEQEKELREKYKKYNDTQNWQTLCFDVKYENIE